jgi:ribulose-5-phosphate 4-epimerase/fuculose-1-phosphate aldolase
MDNQEMREVVESLIRFGREAAETGLLASTSGNVSLRHDERLVISAAGAYLGALTEDDLSVVDLSSGERLSGPPPSLEVEIHRRVCLARPGVGAVLHCQSRAATLLACSEDAPSNIDFIPEIPAYVRAHAYVPYDSPGSGDLATSVGRAFEDPEVTVVQLVNHGQVVIGANRETTVRRAVFFELGCWMATQGRPLRVLPEQEARILRGYARDC